MAFVLIDDGVSSLTVRFVERKKDGSFQYRRRIPQSVRHRYAGRTFFVKSLKRDISKINVLAYEITNILNTQWAVWQNQPQPSSLTALSMSEKHEDRNLTGVAQLLERKKERSVPLLSQALVLYLVHHHNGQKAHFKGDCERVVAGAISLLGDKAIDAFDRTGAERLRDFWLTQGATRTTRRRLITLVAIINKACKEKQLQILNPFEGLGIIGEGEDGTKRIPFDNQELRIIAAACHNLDDDIRHIIALQLDTGSRVAEIVGLRVEDVVLTHPVPHVRIRPWEKVRTLKTVASERDIPLIGNALWAAERAVETRRKAAGKDSWLFPRYASDTEVKATHASATLNKWLRTLAGVCSDKTTHCFRHSMRDRLRAAQVPFEIQECLGGWGSRTIGQGYGSGYPLQVLAEHMRKIRLP